MALKHQGFNRLSVCFWFQNFHSLSLCLSLFVSTCLSLSLSLSLTFPIDNFRSFRKNKVIDGSALSLGEILFSFGNFPFFTSPQRFYWVVDPEIHWMQRFVNTICKLNREQHCQDSNFHHLHFGICDFVTTNDKHIFSLTLLNLTEPIGCL